MRKPEYISPSAVKLYYDDPTEYYRRYLAENRPPKFPQTLPMACGSAFDAYVKSHLHDVIFGKNHKDAAKYELKALFEAQVEPAQRTNAWDIGKHIFDAYVESGALADLMIELQGAVDDPRFEFDLKGEVKGSREASQSQVQGVILMGKPDLRFINAEGAHVIYDWKVNGYCGKSNTSPKPGYVQLRAHDGFWQRMGAHKNALPQMYKGMWINVATFLENIDEDWATQLATYGWLLGEPVGAEIIVGIDQIACNGAKVDLLGRPNLRIANHRMRVSEDFQYKALARYQFLWGIIQSIGTKDFYFFRDLSHEDSKLKCEMLENEIKAMSDPNTPSDVAWALNAARGVDT